VGAQPAAARNARKTELRKRARISGLSTPHAKEFFAIDYSSQERAKIPQICGGIAAAELSDEVLRIRRSLGRKSNRQGTAPGAKFRATIGEDTTMPRLSLAAHARLRLTVFAIAVLAAIATLALALAIAHADDPLAQSGTVTITQTRVAFLISGNAGGGTLRFHGQDYPFAIGGLGIGGIGVTKLEATGTVYNMKDRSQFPGFYSQLRSGITVGDQDNGKLWLKNTNGVVLKLQGASKGIGLSLGGDAVTINYR
jgi:hypothetical protein